MIALIVTITIIFVFFMPYYLKRKDIKKNKNIFDNFVDNDHGYAWSMRKERKESYLKSLDKKHKK